jgi:hypothetical protein
MDSTHRERKEQYVKSLEFEVIRQKESFVAEMNKASRQLEHQLLLFQESQNENAILREILMSRGISYEHELENRKMKISLPIKRDQNSISPLHISSRLHPSTTPSSAAAFSPMASAGYGNGTLVALSGHSPATTMHGSSPAGPEIQEFSVKQERDVTPDVPGIFELEPQLGIDFILQ